MQQSLSNEHYTPQHYLDIAREVLGGIDLDPASCVEVNRIVGAEMFFSTADDGLQKHWSATGFQRSAEYVVLGVPAVARNTEFAGGP